MKRHILQTVIGISLCAVLLSGCSVLFTPTETPAYNISNLVITSDSSSKKESEPQSWESFHFSSANSTRSSAPPESSTPTITSTPQQTTPSETRHPRFLELEQQFSYNAEGKICLSEQESAFADKTLFVGDSICRGFAAYSVTKSRNVYASGSVAARNFFEKDFFYNGEATPFKDLLEEMKPEYVLLWMGMNDVNMTSAAEYCENYQKLINFTLENSSANVYICAITPINSDFTENSRIDAFNLAMKQYIPNNFGQRVGFIDFAYLLKNENNQLSGGLDSGDGIHLAPECYYIAMLEICRQLKVID